MEKLAAIVWGLPMMALLLSVGGILSVQTGFVQVRRLGDSFRHMKQSICSGDRSSFRAVCTALAGTVGTGNIAGVAGAIALGGPGAVFWMWAAAVLGMATKYAEVVLALKYRIRDQDGTMHGGPMYYIQNGMGDKWCSLAALFAFFSVLVSLGMGNIAQIHTMVSAVQCALPYVRPEVVSLMIGLIAALVTDRLSKGGAVQVGTVMEKLVPAAAGLYILGAAGVLVVYRRRLGTVFLQIMTGAFCPEAVLGGGMGIGIRQAVRWGVCRGVFSNEAGLGSAPMAHAAAEAKPEVQGLFGIFEVFFDTIVLCTLTAVTILVSNVPVRWGNSAGTELAAAALETVYGGAGAVGLAVCLVLLSQGTLMTWKYYGTQCAGYLWGGRGETAYHWIHIAAILLGATMNLPAVWAVSDLCNGLVCIPNLIALLYLRKQVV